MKYIKYTNKFPRLDGKTIVVTGASSGIGFYTAKHLAYMGANVIMACRSEERGLCAIKKIKSEIPNAKLEFILYDQASFLSIENLAKRLFNYKLDGFIFNAGVCASKSELKTEQGYDLIMGTNFIGMFYLSELLKDEFIKQKTRVVYVSSFVATLAKKESFITFPLHNSISKNRLYNYSKLCVAEYAYQNMKEGVDAVIVHPGISGTNIVFSDDSCLPIWLKSFGKKLLSIIADGGEKASLVNITAISHEYKKGSYIRPRLPLGFFGLPKVAKIPKKFTDYNITDDVKKRLFK